MPADRRIVAFKALAPYTEAISAKLQELKQAELPEEQLIQYHRIALGAQVAFLLLQALAPTAVPSLWWAFVSQPILGGVPTNTLHGFWYLMGIAFWIVYAVYHVTQGALIRRTESGWPWTPPQAAGLALVPFLNVYGSYVLFSEATSRLGRETGVQGRAGQAKSAVLGALLLSVVCWGLLLARDLGVDIPLLALQVAQWLRAAAQIAALGLTYWMMHKLIGKFAEEGGSAAPPSSDDADAPVRRGPAAPSPGLTAAVLSLLAVAGLVVYLHYEDPFECPKKTSLATTKTEKGERVLYCETNGAPNGPWRVSGKGGAEQFSYSDGRIFGAYTAWYPSGVLRDIGSYTDQSKEGVWQHYSEKGVLQTEQSYVRNVLNGVATKYFPDGKPAEKANYLSGKLHGKFATFHENGVKAEEGMYQSGEKVGHWISWSAAGLVTDERDYTGGPAAAAAAPGAAAPGATATDSSTPDTPATLPPVAMAGIHEVTEKRVYAGRTMEWWEERLQRLKQQVVAGEASARVYELTKRRAQQNGLEVLEGGAEVKVRIAAAVAHGGPP